MGAGGGGEITGDYESLGSHRELGFPRVLAYLVPGHCSIQLNCFTS